MRVFSCPFFKKDPLRHKDCLGFSLRRIQDVKQHLFRKHYNSSIYCPICRQDFSDFNQRDNHIRQRVCTEHSPCRMDHSIGLIPPDKQERLRARVRGSEEELWYRIWEILFDDAPPPATPYQSTIIEEVVDIMQVFWEQHCQKIMSDVHGATPHGTGLDLKQVTDLMSKTLCALIQRVKMAIPKDSCSGSTSSIGDLTDLSSISTTSTEFCPTAISTPASVDVQNFGREKSLGGPCKLSISFPLPSQDVGNNDNLEWCYSRLFPGAMEEQRS